jgi:hypothetical protein
MSDFLMQYGETFSIIMFLIPAILSMLIFLNGIGYGCLYQLR